MNKEQQCRTSNKDGKPLGNIFFNKEAFAVVQKYLAIVYCVGLLLSNCHKEGTIQSTGSVWLSPDHTHFWWWKRDPCHTFTH